MKTTPSLTSAEMGKLWASYLGNTMGKCVLSYYLNHVDDTAIKKVLAHAFSLTESFMKEIETFFKQANFPMPIGMTEDDVNAEAPRLYEDEFYLHYLLYLGKAGSSIYSATISIVTRDDVRNFFIHCLSETAKLIKDVSLILKSMGKLMNDPTMPVPKKVDFVKDQSFLKGYLGNVRPLHGLEVGHLYDNIHNDIASKALIVGFHQVAQNKKVKQYLERGKKINHKHIILLSNKLTEDGLPAPSLIDHLVTQSTEPPFSDKLMVFHKIDMFSMKIREYANGASLNGRRDIGALYAKCLLDVSLYVEDGANIMIDHGWMEQPPLVIDRNSK